ncbi:hypothetical protein [Parerythrobacter jejuensis]|nr:hypothetical protein [Parerythrobacter jejuensis]
MFKKNLAALFGSFAFALSAMAVPAHAQSPVQLSGDVKVEKTTTDESGATKTEYVAPDVVVPGDRLLFTTTFTNSGTEPVENFVVNNPLPAAVRLVDDADPDLTVSVDGGTTFGKLTELSVASEGGVSRNAQAADVTHIRWTLAVVNPGESGRLEYPAIIR